MTRDKRSRPQERLVLAGSELWPASNQQLADRGDLSRLALAHVRRESVQRDRKLKTNSFWLWRPICRPLPRWVFSLWSLPSPSSRHSILEPAISIVICSKQISLSPFPSCQWWPAARVSASCSQYETSNALDTRPICAPFSSHSLLPILVRNSRCGPALCLLW